MPYTEIEELGRGGFGIVHDVVGDDGKRYARKTLVIPPHLDAASVRRRFDREVKYQSTIQHENVVSILDHNLLDDPPWFIMPLAKASLQQELATDRTLGGKPENVLFDILNGLEEIHRHGFCHRDLKPGNVLRFAKPDGSPLYALSDFGLMAVGEDASSTLTPSGIGGGTPLYQAPECAINFRRATPQSDLYSFGALLHDIFAANSKRLPHEELTVAGDAGPVIEKCTKRNSHRRFKNVAELREALFKALSTFVFQFQSGEEQQAVELLTDETRLPIPEEWDRIFDFLDGHVENLRAVDNVLRALRPDHIEQLHDDDPDLMAALGKVFADHCRNHSFEFGYCDVLASKGALFFDFGEVGLKAEMAIALLRLGTSHNRWFVERKFMQMASPTSSSAVAQRIIIELNVLGIDFNREFLHLEWSISARKDQLHPLLQALIK